MLLRAAGLRGRDALGYGAAARPAAPIAGSPATPGLPPLPQPLGEFPRARRRGGSGVGPQGAADGGGWRRGAATPRTHHGCAPAGKGGRFRCEADMGGMSRGGTTSPQCAPWRRGGPEGAVSHAPSHNPHPTTHLPRRAALSAAHAGSRPASSPPFPHGPMSSMRLSSRLGPSQVTPYPGWDPSVTPPSRLGPFHRFLLHPHWLLIHVGIPSSKLGHPHLLPMPQAGISPHAPYPKWGQPTFPPLTTLGTPPISSLYRVMGKKGSAGAGAAVGDIGKVAGRGTHIWGHPGRDNPAGWQPPLCSLPKPH